MAKPLILMFKGQELPFNLEKVDRSRLYGSILTKAFDDQNRPCELASLAGDGCTILARSGTAIAYLTTAGQWRSKSELKAVDHEGRELQPVPSSFNAPIVLDQTATVDVYLSHNIRSVYSVTTDTVPDALEADLNAGTIYTFPFCYRAGIEADTAFLLAGASGGFFMTLGRPAEISFIGHEQAGAVAPEDEPLEDEDDETMDFSMM
jgi:hypothetical protein